MELPVGDQGMRRDLKILNPAQKRKAEAADPSSSSSPSKKKERRSFDVFLSFRGEDTRKNFISHLYKALHQCGIHTFIDNENLEIGERIDELLSYIERSEIFVPVLSKGYADSRWCLKEITKMVECGRLIVPIFFHVEPTHIRNQSGPFEAAFKRHEEKGEEDLSKWKDALRTVGDTSGHSLDTNGNEAELIQKVVEQISRKLNKTARCITDHLVGMDSHIDKINSLLDLANDEVKMIGIVGMGGIAKTTIATVVYNMLLSDFDGSSFIWNIREGFKQYNGGAALQQRLIRDVLKGKDTDVNDIGQGASLIQQKFHSKKVLVVLDDADHIEQLETLAGKRDWFGSGSRIIITSRDERVLSSHRVKKQDIYKPKPLDVQNSFELLNSRAFHGVQPTDSEFHGLAGKVVKRTRGLPLALKVFGSLLYGRNIEQWKEIVQELESDPNEDIERTLRISYDGLKEKVKKIFLDISCFFIGKDKENATYMWEACGLYPQNAISEPHERSLISFNEADEFEMHDLLRDMGRNIAKHEKKYYSHDLLDLLGCKAELKMAEGIVICGRTGPPLSTECFVDCFLPRILHLSSLPLEGDFLHLPKQLKWLTLNNCHFPKKLSGASNLNGLTVLQLIDADDVAGVLIEQSSSKAFDALKVLHLKSSVMNKTPDFSKVEMICLRKLTLENCKNLTEVDESIGSLKSLVCLNLQGCSKLQQLPDSICGLNSLQTLDLEDCSSLSCLPEKLGDLASLRNLNVSGTPIHKLPDSIYMLNSLQTLILMGCLSLSCLPKKLENMTSLRELYADWTSICAVPDSIGKLSNLRTLSLMGIDDLEKLPDSVGMLDSLQELYITTDSDEEINLMKIDSLCFEDGGSAGWLAVVPNSLCQTVKMLEVNDYEMEGLPPDFGRLTNLEVLCLNCWDLIALPEWFGQLKKLKSLELKCREFISFGEGFPLASSVEESSNCSRGLEARPATAGRLKNLKSLKLDCPILGSVPNLILSSGGLQELHLYRCHKLKSLPPLPSSLRVLNARGCNELRTISDLSNLKSLRELRLGRCILLEDFYSLESIAHNLETLELPGPCDGFSLFCQLTPAFMRRIFKEVAFPSLKTFRVSGILEDEDGDLDLDSGEESEEETLDLVSGEEPEEETLDLECIPTDVDFWTTFPKVGRGGKHPTGVVWSSWLCGYGSEDLASAIFYISIMEEDDNIIGTPTLVYYRKKERGFVHWYRRIEGEAIGEYSREGNYLKMQIRAPPLCCTDSSSVDLYVHYT